MNRFPPTLRLQVPVFPGRLLAAHALIAAGVLLLARPVADWLVGIHSQSAAASVPRRAPASGRRTPPPVEGQFLGRLEIPRIHLDLAVFEGTSEATLRMGPGHLAGTPWPAASRVSGNCVIAGHRDSFFRALEKVRADDVVRLRVDDRVETYRLERRRVVRPRDRGSIAVTADSRLTLITCFPFRSWGEAPYRLVWTATRLADDGPRPAEPRFVRAPRDTPPHGSAPASRDERPRR